MRGFLCFMNQSHMRTVKFINYKYQKCNVKNVGFERTISKNGLKTAFPISERIQNRNAKGDKGPKPLAHSTLQKKVVSGLVWKETSWTVS